MRTIFCTVVVAAALLQSAPALAEKDSDATVVNPKDRMVCKRTQRTGTRFDTKVCKTAGQWEAIAEEHRRNVGELANRPIIETRRGNWDE